jgi:hypothetical protein
MKNPNELAKNVRKLADFKPAALAITKDWELAKNADLTARDARLRVAMALGKVKKDMDTAKLSFADWAKVELKGVMSYNTARELAAIGLDPKPEAALTKLRETNAARNKIHRAKVKTGGSKGKAGTVSIETKSPLQVALAAVNLVKLDDLFQIIEAATKRMTREHRITTVRGLVSGLAGFKMVAVDIGNEAPNAGPTHVMGGITSPERVKEALQSIRNGTAFKAPAETPPVIPTAAAIAAAGKAKKSGKSARK